MAVYTMQLRTILDNVDNGFPDLLNMTGYPIYDESHRAELNKKICDHYMYREIGFETVSMFYDRLLARMNEIMPYYNELYSTLAMEYDPLYTDDYTLERHEEGVNSQDGSTSASTAGTTTTSGRSDTITGGETSSSGSETRTAAEDGKNVVSDTPQAMLDRDISYPGWASGATLSESDRSEVVTSSNEGTQSGSDNRTESQEQASATTNSGVSSLSGSAENDIRETRTGRAGRSAMQLIKEYRDNIINVDRQIIAELNDLFMTIY